jgi:hypothetical protein
MLKNIFLLFYYTTITIECQAKKAITYIGAFSAAVIFTVLFEAAEAL